MCNFVQVIFVPHGMDVDQPSDHEDIPKGSKQKLRTLKVQQLFEYFEEVPRKEIEKYTEEHPVCS